MVEIFRDNYPSIVFIKYLSPSALLGQKTLRVAQSASQVYHFLNFLGTSQQPQHPSVYQ